MKTYHISLLIYCEIAALPLSDICWIAGIHSRRIEMYNIPLNHVESTAENIVIRMTFEYREYNGHVTSVFHVLSSTKKLRRDLF